MRTWIENWLIAGLFLNWIGLMVQRYWPKSPQYCQPPEAAWYWEVVGIVVWPFAFALGMVMSRIDYQRRKKK